MVMRSYWELTDFYEYLNWGTLEIDWDRAVVDLQIRDKEGAVVLHHEVRPYYTLLACLLLILNTLKVSFTENGGDMKGRECVKEEPLVAQWRLRQLEYWVHLGGTISPTLAAVACLGCCFSCYCCLCRRRNKPKQA